MNIINVGFRSNKWNALYESVSNTNKTELVSEGLSEKGIENIKSRVAIDGSRKTAIWLIDYCLSKMLGGLTSSDLPDTATFANGIDGVEETLDDEDYDNAFAIAKDTAQEMIDDEGFGL